MFTLKLLSSLSYTEDSEFSLREVAYKGHVHGFCLNINIPEQRCIQWNSVMFWLFQATYSRMWGSQGWIPWTSWVEADTNQPCGRTGF